MTYFNREGERITVEEWQRLLSQDDYRCVAHTTVTSQVDDDVDYVVSTAWLGIDFGISPVGAPLVFETLVFSGDEDGRGEGRYGSEAAALEGHAEVVSSVVSTVPAARVDNGG